MRLKFRFILSRISLISFRNKVNQFVYLMCISLIMVGVIYLFKRDIHNLIIFTTILSTVLSITTIRPSNCLVCNVLTKDLGMNINNPSKFHSLDYYENRKEISELFKEDCVDGIIKLSKLPYCKTMKATTHKWVYKNVLCDERVTNVYEIQAKECGKIKIIQEILALNSLSGFNKYKDRLSKSAYQERTKYKIYFTRKDTI